MSRHNSDIAIAKDPAPVQQQQAQYGQACAGCAKAKCKCIRDAALTGAPCQRCRRIRRECQPSLLVRKRRGGRPPNRTAQIEEKLESLVTLLQSQAHPAASANTPNAVPATLDHTPMVPPAQTNINVPSSLQSSFLYSNGVHHGSTTDTSPASDPLYGGTPSTSTSYSGLPDIDPLQAEETLQFFRTTYIPTFPAIYIPLTTTAAQLRLQKPYLWLAIQSICCRRFSMRAVLQQALLKMFAEQVVVQFECSMDLLLGHIVFATWGNQTDGNKQAFHMSSSMAATLAQDLRLDRDPEPETSSFKAFAYGVTPPQALEQSREGQQSARKERTNEERRAVLACFGLSSSTFHKLGTPPMRWTPHMDECLGQLASQPECEDDEVLVVMTKCSKVLNEVAGSSNWGSGGPESHRRPHNRLPSTLPIKMLRGALDEVRSHVRPPLLEKRVVKFWLLTTEVTIFDLALQYHGSSPSASLNFARTESLQYCLSAINHFLDNFFSFKPREYSGLHFHYWLQYMRCTRIIYRLLLIEDPAWDVNTIQDSVDLMGSLQRGIDICRAVPAAEGLDTDGNDGYSVVATNLQRAKSIWTKTLEQAGVWPTDAAIVGEIQPATVQPILPNDLFSWDLWDDSWMVLN